ncbi:MAG: M48 family metalloprotease [Candidatus Acidiferrales bacterium]
MKIRLILSLTVCAVAAAVMLPDAARAQGSRDRLEDPCRDAGGGVVGEAQITQRAQRFGNMFEQIMNAYQSEGGEREALIKGVLAMQSHQPPEFTQEEKNHMEELAQKPEVKATIEELYREKRMEEVEKAHSFNIAPCFFYPNPMLQDYLNKLGQSLVPKDSEQLYAFRIVYDPRPDAWAFSTGSIYVTTGLVAMMDNEAQMAYVLAHEIGHVEHKHLYLQTRGEVLQQLLEVDKVKSIKKKGMILGAVAGGIGAVAGGARGGGLGALGGATLGYGGVQMVTNIVLALHQPKFTDWSSVEENDADEYALKDTLDHRFDVREAPKVFVTLETTIHRDDRVGMGFHYGRLENLLARRQHIQSIITGAMKADIDAQSKQGLMAATPNFALLVAEVKRDNGIMALDYDLFDEARQNLEEAVALRSTDPVAHLYLGEVYKLTARDPAEAQKAMDNFQQAIQLDTGRTSFPQPHLERALSLLQNGDPSNYPEAQKEIKIYTEMYKLEHAGAVPVGFPVNMRILYDYLSLTGDDNWGRRPVANVVQVSEPPSVLGPAQSQSRAPATQTPTPTRPKPAAKKPAGTD